MLAMIRLTKVLLTLGVGMATATTAIAEDWWAGCNPRLSGSDDPQEQNVRSQWGYVAPAHSRNMYMYVPPHRTHRTDTNGRY
jgi:hypothetical protein